jgi:hypothetical protein
VKAIRNFYEWLSIWDKIKICFCLILVAYAWYYIVALSNPKNLSDLKITDGIITGFTSDSALRGGSWWLLQFYDSERKAVEKVSLGLNYKGIDEFYIYDKQRDILRFDLLQDRKVRIWYSKFPFPFKTKTAYQILILDDNLGERESIKGHRYFMRFADRGYYITPKKWFMLAMSHMVLIFIVLDTISKFKRENCDKL